MNVQGQKSGENVSNGPRNWVLHQLDYKMLQVAGLMLNPTPGFGRLLNYCNTLPEWVKVCYGSSPV